MENRPQSRDWQKITVDSLRRFLDTSETQDLREFITDPKGGLYLLNALSNPTRLVAEACDQVDVAVGISQTLDLLLQDFEDVDYIHPNTGQVYTRTKLLEASYNYNSTLAEGYSRIITGLLEQEQVNYPTISYLFEQAGLAALNRTHIAHGGKNALENFYTEGVNVAVDWDFKAASAFAKAEWASREAGDDSKTLILLYRQLDHAYREMVRLSNIENEIDDGPKVSEDALQAKRERFEDSGLFGIIKDSSETMRRFVDISADSAIFLLQKGESIRTKLLKQKNRNREGIDEDIQAYDKAIEFIFSTILGDPQINFYLRGVVTATFLRSLWNIDRNIILPVDQDIAREYADIMLHGTKLIAIKEIVLLTAKESGIDIPASLMVVNLEEQQKPKAIKKSSMEDVFERINPPKPDRTIESMDPGHELSRTINFYNDIFGKIRRPILDSNRATLKGSWPDALLDPEVLVARFNAQEFIANAYEQVKRFVSKKGDKRIKSYPQQDAMLLTRTLLDFFNPENAKEMIAADKKVAM